MTTNQSPVATIRDGRLSASIWAQVTQDQSLFYTVTFERLYEKDGELKNSNSFSGAELLRIAVLAQDAYQTIGEIRRAANDTGESQAATAH